MFYEIFNNFSDLIDFNYMKKILKTKEISHKNISISNKFLKYYYFYSVYECNKINDT